MRQQNFDPGVKPLSEDLNSINKNTEAGLFDLLRAIGGSSGALLFEDAPLQVVKVGSVFTVTAPTQYIAVSGAIERSTLYSEAIDVDDPGNPGTDLPLQLHAYLMISRQPESAVRNFLSVSPTTGATVQQNLDTEVAFSTTVRPVYIWSNVLVDSLAEPVVSVDDVGFVKLGSFTWDGAVLAQIDNISDRFQLPSGVSVSAGVHAASHLPEGDDEIPAALVTSTSGGSTPGLMPAGAQNAVQNSLQDVVQATGAEYVVLSTSGNNAISGGAIDSKRTEISLRLAGSLVPQDVGGLLGLGANLAPASALAGSDERVARADHSHPLSQSGLVFVQLEELVVSANAGTIITKEITAADLPIGVGIEKILSVQTFWAPPNLAPGSEERNVETGWFASTLAGQGGFQSIGTRIIGYNSNTFKIEIGSGGLAYLSTATENEVESWTSPPYSGGTFPKTGTLRMLVLCRREGANG